MPKRMSALATLAITLALSISAQAGATRTFVSTTSNDANTSADCSPSAPCRTFTAALSVTNAGGEIVVLTSGGYEPATINQPVGITADRSRASISVPASGTGVNVNIFGTVTLIGLSLHGEGTGYDGVYGTADFLRMYNMLIENFTHNGVEFLGIENTGGKVAIYDSEINYNVAGGLLIQNIADDVYVEDTSFDNNGYGVGVFAGQVIVANSSAQHNTRGFLAQGPGVLTLFNDNAAFNATALEAATAVSGGTLYFANCLIANNTVAYSISAGSTMAGTIPGTSVIAPGQSTSGTLSTPISLR